MSQTKKEIIKAIYIQIANDELEFVTIASKANLETKKDEVAKHYPTYKIIVKTFASIEEHDTPKFYKFICEILDNDFIARVVPCSKCASFNVRHLPNDNKYIITIDGDCEESAFYKAHQLYNNLYNLKYIK